MKFRIFFLIIISCCFLQGYKYEHKVEPLDVSKNANNHNAQGVMWMDMGQYNAALSEFQIAIALSPNAPASAVYYNNIGLLYLKVKNYKAAKACFEKAISLNPVFLEYYNNLVELYAQSGRLDSELNKYVANTKGKKKDSYSYFMVGLIYKKKGNNKLAIQYLKEFIHLEPDMILSRAAKQMIYDMMTE